MSGSSSTSFIPKHTPNKPERRSSPRQVFFGTLLVQILFIAVLIAALGVYLYEGKLNSELTIEINKFNDAARSYEADVEKLSAIMAMDKRLESAKTILDESVSVNTLLVALENTVIGTVQLESLKISKEEEITKLTTTVKTDTFDSTMFQRNILQESSVLGAVEIKDVSVVKVDSDDLFESDEDSITFNVTIEVDPESIPSVVVRDSTFIPVTEVITESETEAVSEGGEVEAEVSDG